LADGRRVAKTPRGGRLKVLGESLAEYDGKPPNDSKLEPYYSLAEKLDIPVGIHLGLGPPGTSYFATPGYRMRYSAINPLIRDC